jgi:hypothetical protein
LKKIRQRLTYANVMSSLAVFLILGGATAFAATKIGANQLKANSVKTGKIVKEAVTTSKLKNGSVTTPKLANDAVTGEKANESTFGQVPSAKTAETAGFASTAGTTSNVLWAVVKNPAGAANATLVRSSQPAPQVVESVGVSVIFNRNVTTCAWLATRGLPGAEGAEVPGFAEVNGVAGNANAVEVRVRDDEGTIDDGNFHLGVLC